MYIDIRQLHEQGFNVSQIARKIGLSRTTVYAYLNRKPEEMHVWLAGTKERTKKLTPYHDEILSWVKEHQDMSAAQVFDWLQEKHFDLNVAESTVRRYVRSLRERYQLPKVTSRRQYEAIPDPPLGQQIQVDFGQTVQQTTKKEQIRLYFISFVLSHSRYKAVIWLDRPFTTQDVVRAQEEVFQQLGGMPEEIVYDQDKLILVRENSGDCIFTAEFQSYREERGFRVRMCRKADPESKGRIENVVGFVKKSFSNHRLFTNIDKWNEQCQEWLRRTGNGKTHNLTKKKPVDVFLIEKNHLRPISKAIAAVSKDTSSPTRAVRKDNTICYNGNRYSVPLGTYQHGGSNQIHLSLRQEKLIIIDLEGETIAEHDIDPRKGQLIQACHHRRDRTKGIDAYIESLSESFTETKQATTYLGELRRHYPRYIRDQLQRISETIRDQDHKYLDQTLTMCLDQRLYSAQEFRDVLVHLKQAREDQSPASHKEHKRQKNVRSFKSYQPEVREMDDYIAILKEGGVS